MSPRPPLVLVVLLLSVTSALAQAPPGPGPGAPLPGLSPAELAAFNDGLAAFTRRFAPPDGLGPVFNDDSCAVCHGGPPGGPPPGSANPRTVTRFGRARGRTFDPLPDLGGSLIQSKALLAPCNLAPEAVPAEANVVALRRTQPLFGLGLVDAVPDQALRDLAAAQASSSRKTAGRVHEVVSPSTGTTRAGRFGWKAQVASLRDFSGDALLNEMGITNPLFPDESCPQGDCGLLACNPRPDLNDDGTTVARLTSFQRLLAPPPRGPITPRRSSESRCSIVSTATLATSRRSRPARATYRPWRARSSTRTPTSSSTTWAGSATASCRARPARPRSARRRCGA